MRIGVDEAGRGPCLGPLVVGAFCAPKEDASILRELGVKDSKRLSSVRRSEVASRLSSIGAERGWRMTTILLPPERIDVALAGPGLNWLEVEGFAEAIAVVWPTDAVPSLVLDACDVDEERFGHRVSSLLRRHHLEPEEVQSRHGMDDTDPHVAAASILAKTARDAAVDALSEHLGVPLGSGYPSDPATKAALPGLLQGPEPHTVLRWSWATTKRAWSTIHAGPIPLRTVDGTVLQQRLIDPPSS